MANKKNSLFKFENIDVEKTQAVVRFINIYGPIYTKEKTIDDFKKTIRFHTGSFKKDGSPIMETREEIINDNPNEDIIFSYDIPLNEDGSLYTPEQLVEYIAKQYPESVFENLNKRKKAVKDARLNELVGQDFNIELLYPDIVESTLLNENINFNPLQILQEIIIKE